jgi:hypothetical protein
MFSERTARTNSESERKSPRAAALTVAASVCAMALAAPASATSLSRSVDVNGTPAAVWAMIGPFCAIKDWHPAVGTCTADGKTPPTRTLVTKDGAATFVEPEVARNDAEHYYSYGFKSSPLPVADYKATIKVVANGDGRSTITWIGSYAVEPGKEKDVETALSGIYEAGLAAIKAKLAK